ncbi:MAG: lipoyl(octanoyl) transferase LipB [Chthoniobacterales bacterium]
MDVRWLGRVEFQDGLKVQDAVLADVREGRSDPTLLLLEHHPVFTIGRTRDRSSLLNAEALPFPVHEINRGGQATYHGPGQLVGYPILDLHDHGRDLHRYLRFLEDVLIAALGELGISAGRRDGLTGVWVEDRKIASIGVGVRYWVTMHGFALNVSGELAGFSNIVPCGIAEVEMTSIERELGFAPSVEEFGAVVAAHFDLASIVTSPENDRSP